ncbi:unnamed protein product [Candidula unifasciata]|uniref:Uncharacterized protein n=1 Tax=Candidula unifasciata TaxID=100452 RepID=A0A8S4A373_9EUPU|nr:unnamed protein product [Candidula unifasciata]
MMGNKQTQLDPSMVGLEMASAREFTNRRLVASLCDMQELWRDCLALRNGVERLVETLNEVFVDKDGSEKMTNEIRQKLNAVLKFNQAISRKITRNLERHGKMVDRSIQQNEQLMFIVKDFVASINTSMTMLVRNIIKMRRLISEMQPSLGLTRVPKGNLVFDVINDNQDVDAMLRQLVETEGRRESLENYMVNVLACWRDFRYLLLVTNDWETTADDIDSHVKAVADNVARGLMQLRRYTR